MFLDVSASFLTKCPILVCLPSFVFSEYLEACTRCECLPVRLKSYSEVLFSIWCSSTLNLSFNNSKLALICWDSISDAACLSAGWIAKTRAASSLAPFVRHHLTVITFDHRLLVRLGERRKQMWLVSPELAQQCSTWWIIGWIIWIISSYFDWGQERALYCQSTFVTC